MKKRTQLIFLLMFSSTFLCAQSIQTYFVQLSKTIEQTKQVNFSFVDSLDKWGIKLKPVCKPSANLNKLSCFYTFSLTEKEFNKIEKKLRKSNVVLAIEKEPVVEVLYYPNDPYADINLEAENGQTPVSTHDFYTVWDIEKGDTNIVIGVVDTGIWFDHEDIQKNIKFNYNELIDGVNDGNDSLLGEPLIDNYRGWDVADWDNDPSVSGESHGLQVAGILAATPDNNIGITGLGFNTKILPIKVSPNSSPSSITHGYSGIVYAAEHGCRVINLSWGGTFFPGPIYQELINSLISEYDVVIVVAAGNSSIEEEYYPSSYDNVISVTGIRADTSKQKLSTYNYKVDLCAVGWKSKTLQSSLVNPYMESSGTSFAAPVVSATAALLLAKKPDFTSQQVRKQLRVSALIVDTFNHVVNGVHRDNRLYINKMGKMLNPVRALTDFTIPGIECLAIRIPDSLSMPSNGRDIEVEIDLTNILAIATDLTVTIESLDSIFSFTSDEFSSIDVPQGGHFSLKTRLIVPENTTGSSGSFPIKLTYSGEGYLDYEIYTVTYFYIDCDLIAPIVTITAPDCSSTHGFVSFNGLIDDENYIVNYNYNGIAQNSLLSAVGGGAIIGSLEDGIYSDFTIDSLACRSDMLLNFTLETPINPMPKLSTVSSSDLFNDGQIVVTKLSPNTLYELSYFYEELQSNSLEMTDDDGRIILNNLSFGVYEAFTVDSMGCVYSSSDDLVIDGIANVFEIDLNQNINIFPNPFQNTINIYLDFDEFIVLLYSSSGELLRQNKYVNEKNVSLDLRELRTGSYFLKIESEQKTIYNHMIKL